MPPGRWSSLSVLCGGRGLVVAWCLGARGFRWQCAGGARPRCGVGHGGFAAVGGRARCRVHVQHPWPPPFGGCCPLLRWGLWPPPWGAARLLFWWGVCWVRPFRRDPSFVGGLWWLWWVVCDLYSGCEHLCCLRASPLLVSSCACAWGVWGGVWPAGPVPLLCWGRGVWACFLLCVVLWGIRWMPWHQELMKDVAACDMPRGVGERALIRGCPNGGTRPGLCWATII